MENLDPRDRFLLQSEMSQQSHRTDGTRDNFLLSHQSSEANFIQSSRIQHQHKPSLKMNNYDFNQSALHTPNRPEKASQLFPTENSSMKRGMLNVSDLMSLKQTSDSSSLSPFNGKTQLKTPVNHQRNASAALLFSEKNRQHHKSKSAKLISDKLQRLVHDSYQTFFNNLIRLVGILRKNDFDAELGDVQYKHRTLKSCGQLIPIIQKLSEKENISPHSFKRDISTKNIASYIGPEKKKLNIFTETIDDSRGFKNNTNYAKLEGIPLSRKSSFSNQYEDSKFNSNRTIPSAENTLPYDATDRINRLKSQQNTNVITTSRYHNRNNYDSYYSEEYNDPRVERTVHSQRSDIPDYAKSRFQNKTLKSLPKKKVDNTNHRRTQSTFLTTFLPDTDMRQDELPLKMSRQVSMKANITINREDNKIEPGHSRNASLSSKIQALQNFWEPETQDKHEINNERIKRIAENLKKNNTKKSVSPIRINDADYRKRDCFIEEYPNSKSPHQNKTFKSELFIHTEKKIGIKNLCTIFDTKFFSFQLAFFSALKSTNLTKKKTLRKERSTLKIYPGILSLNNILLMITRRSYRLGFDGLAEAMNSKHTRKSQNDSKSSSNVFYDRSKSQKEEFVSILNHTEKTSSYYDSSKNRSNDSKPIRGSKLNYGFEKYEDSSSILSKKSSMLGYDSKISDKILDELRRSVREDRKKIIDLIFSKSNIEFARNLEFFVNLDKVVRIRYKSEIHSVFSKLKGLYSNTKNSQIKIVPSSSQKSLPVEKIQNIISLYQTLTKLHLAKLRNTFTQIQKIQNRELLRDKIVSLMAFSFKYEQLYHRRLQQGWEKLRLTGYYEKIKGGVKTLSKYFSMNFKKNTSAFFVKLSLMSAHHQESKDKKQKSLILLENFFEKKLKNVFGELRNNTNSNFYTRIHKKKIWSFLVSKLTQKRIFALQKSFIKWHQNLEKKPIMNKKNTAILSKMIRSLDKAFKKANLTFKKSAFDELQKFTEQQERFEAAAYMQDVLKTTKMRLMFSNLKIFSQEQQKLQARNEKLNSFVDMLNSHLQSIFVGFAIKAQIVNHKPKKIIDPKKFDSLFEALSNLRKSNLAKGIKMIELESISKRNHEKLALNLALKTIFLIKKKREFYKEDFFNRITYISDMFEEKKHTLERLIARQYIKTISFYFSRFRNELATIKINQSLIDTSIKTLKLAIEKLDRMQRESKSHAFRKIFIHAKKEGGISHDKSYIINELSQLSRFEVLNHSMSVVELNKRILEFIKTNESILLKMKAFALRKIKSSANDRFEKLKHRVAYVEQNILKKLFFKNKFLCFAHIKFVTEKMKEKRVKNTAHALQSFKKRIQRLSKLRTLYYVKLWKKNVKKMNEMVQFKAKNLALFRMRKVFTDWRVLYIKRTNRRTTMTPGIFKLSKLIYNKISKHFIFLKKNTKKPEPKSNNLSIIRDYDKSVSIISSPCKDESSFLNRSYKKANISNTSTPSKLHSAKKNNCSANVTPTNKSGKISNKNRSFINTKTPSTTITLFD